MPKVDLKEIREKELAKQKAFKARLFVCASTGSIASGCKDVMSLSLIHL